MDIMIVDEDEDDIALFCEAVAHIQQESCLCNGGNGVESDEKNWRPIPVFQKMHFPGCQPAAYGRPPDVENPAQRSGRYAGIPVIILIT